MGLLRGADGADRDGGGLVVGRGRLGLVADGGGGLDGADGGV